jgi:hypothetical protein
MWVGAIAVASAFLYGALSINGKTEHAGGHDSHGHDDHGHGHGHH